MYLIFYYGSCFDLDIFYPIHNYNNLSFIHNDHINTDWLAKPYLGQVNI